MAAEKQRFDRWHLWLSLMLISLVAESAALAADPPKFPPPNFPLRDLPPAPQFRAPPAPLPLALPSTPRRAVATSETTADGAVLVDIVIPAMTMIDIDSSIYSDGDGEEVPVTSFGNDAFVDAGVLVDPSARLR